MDLRSIGRLPRVAVAGFAVALALAAGIAASGSPARAATQDISVSLSPTSGSDFTTDTGTLSWSVPSACVGQQLIAVMYRGAAPWDATTIAQTLTDATPGSPYYGIFYYTYGGAPAAATGSASWPNVWANGYTSFTSNTKYATTGDFVAAQGTGLYTIGVVCTNSAGSAPLTDSSGNPIAGSLLVNLGATGNSWAVSQAVDTQTTLSGQGEAEPLGDSVSLSATVTASDGSTPVGGVNFYAGGTASGTPLNGSTPVPVGSTGQATYSSSDSNGSSGSTGYFSYTAVFVPTNTASYTSSTGTADVDLFYEDASITVTATQDPSSSTTVDLTATATGSPESLAEAGAPGVTFTVDGTATGTVAQFSSSGVATTQVTGVEAGAHTFSAQLDNGEGSAIDGVDVTVTPATLTTGVITATTLAVPSGAGDGLKLTATVASTGGSTVVPAGKVTVTDGSATVGTVTVSGAAGSGKASGSVTDFSLPAGANDLTATFTPTDPAAFTSSSSGTQDYTLPAAVAWVQAGTPAISGTAAVGDTLTAHPGTWGPSGVRLAYQWLANGAAISGATGSTLVLGTGEYGKTVTVEVTGYAPGDIAWEAGSAATGKVGVGTLTGSTPTISGTVKVNDTLTAHAGSWTSGTTLHYQWYANGAAISRATGSAYKISSGVQGKKLEVKVTGTKTDYTTLVKTSKETGTVPR
jgi:hypothetical protein